MPRKRIIDPETVRTIKGSTESNSWWGRKIGCSAELIRQLRSGDVYRDLLDETGPLGGSSCERCQHWRGFEMAEPCDLGHRDPITDGVGFARICATFRKA